MIHFQLKTTHLFESVYKKYIVVTIPLLNMFLEKVMIVKKTLQKSHSYYLASSWNYCNFFSDSMVVLLTFRAENAAFIVLLCVS